MTPTPAQAGPEPMPAATTQRPTTATTETATTPATSHAPEPEKITAPEWDVAEWIGEPSPLASLRGKVVMLETFQMLCAGCVNHGLPQAKRVKRFFPDVAVIGLHTVFEHHEVTGPAALRVFLQEFGIRFPVGIDRHDGDPGSTGARTGAHSMPITMRTYGLEGTPSTLLFGRDGVLRFSHLGQVDDLPLGVMIGQLLAEPAPEAHPVST